MTLNLMILLKKQPICKPAKTKGKLKKYGIGWCGDAIGFVGHWDGSELIKTETELFPFLKELEKNWPMIYRNFSILDDSQNKIIDGWKDGWK